MGIDALPTTINTKHIIGIKDTSKHELLLCTTQQSTVNSNSKTSEAHPYLRNRSNAHSGVT
eukprot:13806341-Ditylum_brightwellii.AAC.1